MKKIIITALVLFIASSLCANCSSFSDFAGMQNPQSQFRLLEQQRFRQEEYNEFEDMKQQKEARNKKIELENKFKEQQKSQPEQYNQNVNLILEDGQLKLKAE